MGVSILRVGFSLCFCWVFNFLCVFFFLCWLSPRPRDNYIQMGIGVNTCSDFLSLPWRLKEMKPAPSPSFQQWKTRGFGKRAVYQNATWLIASRGGLLFSIFFAIVCFNQLATFWFAGQFGVPEILASPETEFSSGGLGMLHMYPLPCIFFRGAGPPKRDSSSRI